MKQAVVTGVRQGGVIEVPEPAPRGNWVKVKVLAAPMCTEVKGFVHGDGSHGYGHEAAGEVVAIAQPCRVKPGDRVVVQPGTPCGSCDLCVAGDFIHCERWIDHESFTGGRSGLATMAQYILKPDWLLSPIPDGMSYDLASLAVCGLGPTFEAFERMRVDAFDTVLITGLGAVGLGGVVNAVFRGARVIGVEANDYRAELARTLGAETVLDPADPDLLPRIRALTRGRGVPKAVDCSGMVKAHTLCLDAASRLGHMAFVGQCWEPTPLPVSQHMIRKGLTLHGIWHYNLSAYPRLLQVIERSPVVGRMITHTFPLAQVQQAWETQVSGRCGKVILHPWNS
jgi:L-iditol 2-dehydrogenase